MIALVNWKYSSYYYKYSGVTPSSRFIRLAVTNAKPATKNNIVDIMMRMRVARVKESLGPLLRAYLTAYPMKYIINSKRTKNREY